MAQAPTPSPIDAPIDDRRRAVAAPDEDVTWTAPWVVDVALTVRLLCHGAGDPCHQRLADGRIWRASRMETGAVAYRLSQVDPRTVRCEAWGPGAAELVAALPSLLGERDAPHEFRAGNALMDAAVVRHPGLRVPRTARVLESLIPAILEQRVTTEEAFTAWRRLVTWHGDELPEGTPAPRGMRVPPGPRTWAQVPSWDWHRAGVDTKRARTALQCAQVAARLEACADLDLPTARRLLRLVPGVGVWTAAEVAQRALGDADAVSVGDFHLARFVGWALVGRRVDDEEMVRLLEPWRGQRYRAVRLLQLSGFRAPTGGTRSPRREHLRY